MFASLEHVKIKFKNNISSNLFICDLSHKDKGNDTILNSL